MKKTITKKMFKCLVVASIVSLSFPVGKLSTYAASNQTTVKQQNLKPGQDGYVGALNNRPSNTPTSKNSKLSPSSISINPNNAGYWYQYEPSTIRVLMRTDNNPNNSGSVSSYNFGYYLKNVLPNEWVGSWPTQSLEAGAVSIRSYGWYCTNNPKYPSVGADLDNTVNSQVFKPGTEYSATNSAVSSTSGEALIRSATEIPGYYKAGSYSSGRDSSSYNFYNNAYQNGEHYYADNGKSYSWMLDYYYPGTSVITGSGS